MKEKCFPICTFNAYAYFFIISEKTSYIKIYKKYYEPHRIYLTTEEKPKPSGQKTVPFLMQSCSIQILVLHSGNGHMQKSTGCYLRHGGE